MSDISAERGKVMQFFSVIEGLMNSYICAHYFKTNENLDFFRNILENEYFTTHLRIKAFEGILKEQDTKTAFPFETLRRLQNIRNIVAHRPEYQGVAPTPDGTSVQNKGEAFYFHQGKRLEISKLHQEFFKKKDEVIAALNKLPGVIFITNSPETMTSDDVKSLTKRFKIE